MQNATSQTADGSSISVGGLAPRALDDDLLKTALNLASSALIRIRLLNETASRPQGDESRNVAIELIGKLADGAHNLPVLVAQFGTNEWASESTLRAEIGLCKDALRQATARMG